MNDNTSYKDKIQAFANYKTDFFYLICFLFLCNNGKQPRWDEQYK